MYTALNNFADRSFLSFSCFVKLQTAMTLVELFTRSTLFNVVVGFLTGFIIGHMIPSAYRHQLLPISGGIRNGILSIAAESSSRQDDIIGDSTHLAVQLNVTSTASQVFDYTMSVK
jgi:hypothetical protein